MKRTVCLSVLSLLGFGALGAQNAPEGFWTDPSVASEGKADSRPEFVSYSTREQAETGDPSRSPHYVSLEGKWRVRYSTMASGGERDFYLPSFSAALYAIILSFSPKFDALVNSIPTAIVGGVSFILYGMISAVGVRNVVENKVDLTKSRNLIIAAVIFVSGLGFSSTGGITFTVGGADVTLTGLAIAALAGVILNAILPGNDYQFGVDPQGDKSADLGSY